MFILLSADICQLFILKISCRAYSCACFRIFRYFYASPLKVFPFMKEMVSMCCVNAGVILNVSLSLD
jgi:hypothetical protein